MKRREIESLFPFQSRSAVETMAFGERLGTLLQAGDVIALAGDLGAGKTHLTKGIAAALGVDPGDVSSPTFTIAHEYEGRVPVYHLDWYRLSDAEEARHAGLEEYLRGDGICIVEWPQRALDLLPDDTLFIRLIHGGEDVRTLELMG